MLFYLFFIENSIESRKKLIENSIENNGLTKNVINNLIESDKWDIKSFQFHNLMRSLNIKKEHKNNKTTNNPL